MVYIHVYKDRNNNWRWKMRGGNRRILGASTESFKKRTWCIVNLATVTGILITLPRGFNRPNIRRSYRNLTPRGVME